MMCRRFLLLLPVLLMLAACSTNNSSKLQHEEFGQTNVFTRSFAGTDQSACEAARRALLSQGYVINDWQKTLIKGRRKYQHDADVHSEIEFNVVCVADSKGSNSTTVFANAIRDRYSLKKSNNSASIGVSAIGSVSLPFGSTDDALVKVASETIPTGQFYNQFFDLLDRYLDSTRYPNESDTDKKDMLLPENLGPTPSPPPELKTPAPHEAN
ncbi:MULTISPECIES: DUF2242 domain-containing protein [unclassified Undibacterium]|uniref:DUF2242 domain-containing protein n=2 Tax=Undibacterium TaxID=401469 RepID=UPI002AC92693|nr:MULTISPECIES: DUF2242 domain-containing protein [unclassified Undibacterium]MEB0214000.1 DUF2242 domain-containing protein [Undibacterium sp. 5I2]WPX43616.1 DUF2242 domain-containing protein [Undibacterium sp. CCC3.4]